jgi:hypothetical protein
MKKLLALLVTALLISFGAAQPTVDGAIADGEYANSVTEEESGTVISWTVEGDMVYMAVQAEAEGWYGVGWAPEIDNRKAGFDQLIFTIVDGEAVAYDMFQDRARGTPAMDEEEGGSNSLAEFAATHDGAAWAIEFVRPLDTGEEADVAITPGSEMVLAIAHGETMDIERDHPRSSRGGAAYIEGVVF